MAIEDYGVFKSPGGVSGSTPTGNAGAMMNENWKIIAKLFDGSLLPTFSGNIAGVGWTLSAAGVFSGRAATAVQIVNGGYNVYVDGGGNLTNGTWVITAAGGTSFAANLGNGADGALISDPGGSGSPIRISNAGNSSDNVGGAGANITMAVGGNGYGAGNAGNIVMAIGGTADGVRQDGRSGWQEIAFV